MLESPTGIALSAFLLVSTLGYLVSIIYLSGGRGAVRRQARQLAILTASIAVLVVAVPYVMRLLSGLAFWVLMLTTDVVAIVALLRFRAARKTADETRTRPTSAQTRAIVMTTILYAVAVAVAFAAIAMSRGGG